MNVEGSDIVRAIALGVGATVGMDLWNLFLKRAFGIPSLDYCLLGRWVRHMASGMFRHASIAKAAERSYEYAVGWATHYAIGVSLAIAFVVLASGDWLAKPTLLPALLFGVVTVLFPFLVLQPALGFGVASAKAAKPAQARIKSLGTHLVFGLGLYASAVVLDFLLRPT